MKKTRTILYLLLLSYALKAQQTSIVGTVTVFNSKTETGKRQFIQNAQVEETFGKLSNRILRISPTFRRSEERRVGKECA